MKDPDVIIVRLMGEPQGKGRPRSRIASSRGGKQFVAVYTPQATRTYESALKHAGKQAMKDLVVLEDPLSIFVRAVMPIPASWAKRKRAAARAGEILPTTKPDFDNIVKTLDALNEIVWLDDKQIVRAQIEKVYGDEPHLLIEVRPIRAGADVALA